MARPRPGDRIYIPARLGTAGDDFAGGLCTIEGVYTPSVADAVVTAAGTVETPRVLEELARGGSARTWVSVAEDPGSWFEWDGYLEPLQQARGEAARASDGGVEPSPTASADGEQLERAFPQPVHMHAGVWLRPTPWGGVPASLELSEWCLRATVRGRPYIDVPVSSIQEVGTRWDDLGTGFRVAIGGNTYRFWLLFPGGFGDRVPRWLKWSIAAGFSIGILLAIGWPTLGVAVLFAALAALVASLWLDFHRAQADRNAWLRVLAPTDPESGAFLTAVAACDQADTHIEAGRVADAIERYQAALGADPRSARAYLGLGQALARLGRLNDTAAAFRRAWALDPRLFERDLRKHGGSFAFNVDRLLDQALGDSRDYGRAIDHGMAAVMEAGLRGGGDPGLDAGALLSEKRAESDRAAQMIEESERMADDLATADGWRAIQERMQRGDSGPVSAAAAMLVEVKETSAPRPSGEALLGHASRLAEWVYAVGLEISIRHAELARRLVGEPLISVPRRGDVYAPISEMPGGTPYVILPRDGSNESSKDVLAVPLAFGQHPSRFQVACRFDGRDVRAVLDEMKTIHADRLERRLGAVDEESLAAIESGLRQLFGD